MPVSHKEREDKAMGRQRRGSMPALQPIRIQLSPDRPTARANKSPPWRKVQNLVKWTPFIQVGNVKIFNEFFSLKIFSKQDFSI